MSIRINLARGKLDVENEVHANLQYIREFIASGGKGQYLYTTSRWDPCKVDRVLKDREEASEVRRGFQEATSAAFSNSKASSVFDFQSS